MYIYQWFITSTQGGPEDRDEGEAGAAVKKREIEERRAQKYTPVNVSTV